VKSSSREGRNNVSSANSPDKHDGEGEGEGRWKKLGNATDEASFREEEIRKDVGGAADKTR
jgi:hypothetical protein